MIKVPVVNESSNELPEYATPKSAGFDFRADVSKVKEKFTWNCILSYDENGIINKVIICPGGRALIPTGLHMSIPEGYMLAVVTRSGIGLKNGITMANSYGVIDADYRGDIGLIVQNNGFEPFTVVTGDRVGQGLIYKCEQAEFTLVDKLDKTERGEGGYGHTGVRN